MDEFFQWCDRFRDDSFDDEQWEKVQTLMLAAYGKGTTSLSDTRDEAMKRLEELVDKLKR